MVCDQLGLFSIGHDESRVVECLKTAGGCSEDCNHINGTDRACEAFVDAPFRFVDAKGGWETNLPHFSSVQDIRLRVPGRLPHHPPLHDELVVVGSRPLLAS
ncbi:hypothetical protein HPP92_029140 [Vanilla planifolia]|uniref:Uncharacterized protein n=1 Tax=Vanilla planifolia TaxID=51239 RepID=A0A835U2Y0_VANPL|nr:hypothetical protein HPP92_029140 [Vanilla planifolia]KAG0445851.1 hypothetical protein HPP92_029129 [Vanilla planifolia]